MVKKLWWREIKRKWIRTESDAPEARLFTEPRWQNHVAPWYLVYRWLILTLWLVIIVCSVFEIGSYNPEGIRYKWPIYLTNWDLVLGALQALLAALLVCKRWKLESRGDFDASNLILGKAEKVYWFLYIVTSTLAIGVTAAYWCTVYDPRIHHKDPLNFMIHACNTLLMVVDGFVVATPLRFRHFWWCLSVVIFYLVFSLVYFVAGGLDKKGLHYMYSVLDWKKPRRTALISLGGLIFLATVHCSLCLLAGLWNRLQTRTGMKKASRRHNDLENGPPMVRRQVDAVV